MVALLAEKIDCTESSKIAIPTSRSTAAVTLLEV